MRHRRDNHRHSIAATEDTLRGGGEELKARATRATRSSRALVAKAASTIGSLTKASAHTLRPILASSATIRCVGIRSRRLVRIAIGRLVGRLSLLTRVDIAIGGIVVGAIGDGLAIPVLVIALVTLTLATIVLER